LRIEDTDIERSAGESEKVILENLRWLGIDWDEGPDVGGKYGPYRQSERLEIYRDYARKLLNERKAYKCYCLPEELEEIRRTFLAQGKMPKYDGRCWRLTEKERKRFEDDGKKPSIRFRVKQGGVTVDDCLRGKISFKSDVIGDFIIVRSDGRAAYNFAVAIDDFLMKISHVIRGEDHLSNTPRQILIYQALNFPLPKFFHHSLIFGPDRTKLSKRHGVTSVDQFKESGFLPDALVNYLSGLGGALGEGEEFFSLKEIIGRFSLEGIGRSTAIFDLEKVKWINKAQIKKLGLDQLTDLLIPFIEDAGYDARAKERGWLTQVVDATREGLKTLSQIGREVGIFFQGDVELEPEAIEILKSKGALNLLETFRQEINFQQEITEESYREVISRIKKKTKLEGKELFMPIRSALTGKTRGPELEKVLPILGREVILRRINKGLKDLDYKDKK
jgi:nondiscriminating glutamyl-tRNA synthetase